MTTGAYCNNADCSHEFDKPSFAEILARKRECPACGAINYVSDDLGTALDEAFAKVAAGTTVPQEAHETAVEANTAPKFVGILLYQIGDVAAIRLPAGVALPTGLYTVLLTKED